jgi:hypothetical protein
MTRIGDERSDGNELPALRPASPEQFPQLDLRLLQDATPLGGETSAASIDLKIEHGHRRLKWRGFAPVTLERRAAQRQRDLPWTPFGKDAAFQVERVAFLHYLRGPFAFRV